MNTKRIIILFLVFSLVFSLTACKRDTGEYEYYSEYIYTSDVITPIENDNSSITSEPNNSSSLPDKIPSSSNSSDSEKEDEKNSSESGKAPEDKAKYSNTEQTSANQLFPMSSKSDEKAIELRQKILNTKDDFKVKGKTYYISWRGNDDNDGTSPDKAWRTIRKLSNSSGIIRNGDAVVFERGGVYRGTFTAISGVYYGAFGKGEKPCIYESKANAAKTQWYEYDENIWVSPQVYGSDVGIVVFDHGKQIGDKKLRFSEVTEDYDFYYNAGRVFLYLSEEPSTKFSSIEIGSKSHIISIKSGSSDIVIDNLALKYGGAHAVQASDGVKNITVKNCEIGWIGGSLWSGDARYGNGVEFWCGCENILVDNCWLYQIYDSALSHQGNGEFVVKDLTFSNNLIEYAAYGSIEYWAPSANTNELINIRYTDNIMRFAGHGWGAIGRSAPGIHLCGDSANKSTNFVISGNIMDIATKRLISVGSTYGTLPVMQSNTYIQDAQGYLGIYSTVPSGKKYFFDDNVHDVIKNVLGDNTGIAIVLQPE